VVEDVGQYCRDIESHLTRVNAGHLVRIVGPGFALVRQWYQDGIPLSVVLRGIEDRAERHNAGAARRPLRIEFCEGDVRRVFEAWRRAVGVPAAGGDGGAGDVVAAAATPEDRRRPSLSRHLERVIERLGRAAGRLDVPEVLRDLIGRHLGELSSLRAQVPPPRGAGRDAIVARLAALDAELADALRASAPDDVRAAARADAERELEAFRDRLPPERWHRAVDVGVDRLLRDGWGLPTLEM
jgi:hypothetical protein